MSTSQMTHALEMEQPDSRAILRALVIGVIAFLTVVDLFATQAILPALTHAYRTSPAVMSFAVNASTIGMAIAGLAMAMVGRRINRRLGHAAVADPARLYRRCCCPRCQAYRYSPG